MKISNTNRIALTVIALLAFTSSCSEREEIPQEWLSNGNEKADHAYLDLNENMQAAKSGFLLHIRTDKSWSIETDQDWCILSQYSGSGNASLMGTVQANTGTDKRSATLIVKIGEQAQSLLISQNGSEEETTPPNPDKPEGYARGIEVPALSKEGKSLFITHTTNYNGKTVVTYSYEWDCLKKHSRWVAFTFSTATPYNGVGSNKNFKEDTEIPEQYRTTLNDYKSCSSRYSRGHLCASSDRQYSQEANRQTFLLSNMSPQIQNGFNGGIWNQLEQQVQKWGKISVSSDTLYVAKGGTISDGQIKEYVGVNNDIPVPQYYFMAILSLKGGAYHAIGFWLEHRKYNKEENYRNYALSIDELEQKTGIDFFANLPDNIEQAVESSYKESDWSW